MDLGDLSICAYAGHQRRALDAIAAIRGYLRRHPRPQAIRARQRLNHLLQKSAAKTPLRRSRRPEYGFQIAVGYVLSDGEYELLFFNERGLRLTQFSEARGPFVFGSGVSDPHPFEAELSRLVEEQNQKNDLMGSSRDFLVHGTHLLAAAFSNTYLSKESDPATGGGMVILTLSAKLGVEYYTYSELEGDIAAMENPGELWKHRSPELVTAAAIHSAGQTSAGMLIKHGTIVSLLGDERNVRLSVLTRAETEAVTLRSFRGPLPN